MNNLLHSSNILLEYSVIYTQMRIQKAYIPEFSSFQQLYVHTMNNMLSLLFSVFYSVKTSTFMMRKLSELDDV